MDRRNFLNTSSIALLTATLAELSTDCGFPIAEAQEMAAGTAPSQSTLQFTKKSDPEIVKGAYQIGAKDLGASAVPYCYAYFDEKAKKFVNPLDLKPTLEKKAYTMQPTLHSFNIRKADQANFKNLQNQVQLGFNATAPVTKSDELTWVFMNAVDVFLSKDKTGKQAQLTPFTNSSGQSATPLSSTPKISVVNGTVSLQVTVFGQRKDSLWVKFFDILSKVVSNPVISTASKGFGIPGLATQALGFVDGVLDVIAQQNKLVPLWKTGSLEFAVTKDATARFSMTPGLWATVDADYAQSTNFLADHSVDLTYESFRIMDKTGQPVDANYLLTDITFTPSS